MANPVALDELLRVMVGFDTVNAAISGRADTERPLAEFLETQAEARGFGTTRLPIEGRGFNLLVTFEAAAGAPWLMFESHLDTVSVENMTVDPFAGEIRNGRMYGRGACDTKASGAAMLAALTRYREAEGGPNNVAVLYTIDEELGKTGVKAFVREQLAGLGWTPAGVIVGEPTMLQPVVAHNGIARWKIRTTGVAAHSADPSKGRSAISMMAKVIEAIESRYVPALETHHALTGKAQCSINVIHGGTQVNIIPETCEIELDRRIVPGEDPGTVLPAVEAVLEALRAEYTDLTVSQDQPFTDPPLDPAGSEAFIARVRRVLRSMALNDAEMGVGYGTDASTFGEVDVPAVVLGPGDIAQAHTHDEWIEMDQVHRAADVYLSLMCEPVEAAT